MVFNIRTVPCFAFMIWPRENFAVAKLGQLHEWYVFFLPTLTYAAAAIKLSETLIARMPVGTLYFNVFSILAAANRLYFLLVV